MLRRSTATRAGRLLHKDPTLLPLETAGQSVAFIISKFVWVRVFWPMSVSLWHELGYPKQECPGACP